MSRFKSGDRVTVTNPIEPTSHQGGEQGVVVETHKDLVRVKDADGQTATCFREELTKD